jgi:Bacteriophage HK97-gp10, putative tail-component
MINVTLIGQDSVTAALNGVTNPQTISRAVFAMAESYVDDTLDYIQQGRAFQPRLGQLGQSIGWRPTSNNEAEVYANAQYARYVEEGTGIHAGHQPWIIRPKDGRKALKIPVAGGYILRRAVHHDGSRAFPFFYADRARREQNMVNRAIHVIQQMAGV